MISFDSPLHPGKNRPTGAKVGFVREWPLSSKNQTFTGWSIFIGVERTIKTDKTTLDHWLEPLPAD